MAFSGFPMTPRQLQKPPVPMRERRGVRFVRAAAVSERQDRLFRLDDDDGRATVSASSGVRARHEIQVLVDSGLTVLGDGLAVGLDFGMIASQRAR